MKIYKNDVLVYDGQEIELSRVASIEECNVSDLRAERTSKENRENKKLNTDYNGTNISITSKDALGLLQVKVAFELGITETNFRFQNGTVMHIKADEFQPLAQFFAEKRNELFTS